MSTMLVQLNNCMTPLDILYTPLDIPDPPAVNCDQLVKWVCKYQEQQQIENRGDSSQVLKEIYPWNIIYCKHQYQWYENFDTIFPNLAAYCSQAFGIPEDQISDIVILHTKNDFIGQGFWHTDGDEWGLRFYLDNQETKDFLHIAPTKLPYRERSDKTILTNTKDKLQDIIYSARLLKPTQGFFINNIRAVHAVYTSTPGAMRISFSIIVPEPIVKMSESVQNLIVRSAEQYQDYSILWRPFKSVG